MKHKYENLVVFADTEMKQQVLFAVDNTTDNNVFGDH